MTGFFVFGSISNLECFFLLRSSLCLYLFWVVQADLWGSTNIYMKMKIIFSRGNNSNICHHFLYTSKLVRVFKTFLRVFVWARVLPFIWKVKWFPFQSLASWFFSIINHKRNYPKNIPDLKFLLSKINTDLIYLTVILSNLFVVKKNPHFCFVQNTRQKIV